METAAGASAARKLVLGTVQLGLKYGIANRGQAVPAGEACALLQLAHARGIRMLDTAPAYGESESVVGRCLAELDGRFQIVTKTLPLPRAGARPADVDAVRREFSASLKRLGSESVYGILVHHAGDLLGPEGARLYGLLAEWRDRGQALKIGVSVYTGAEALAAFERYRLDIVQLPLSVFDQRLAADGTLLELKRRHAEIHARSVFLQGLALMEPDALPPGFESARPFVARFHDALANRGVSPVAGALGYVAQIAEIDRIVVGVDSAAQLSECVAALEQRVPKLDFSGFACRDESLLDPRRWAEREGR